MLLKELLKLIRRLPPDERHPLPIVEIGWIDAQFNLEDDTDVAEDFGSLTALVSVGHLVRANRQMVVLATDRCPAANSFRTSMTIPMGWVAFVRVHAPDGIRLIPGPSLKGFFDHASDAEITALGLDAHRPVRKGRPQPEGGEA